MTQDNSDLTLRQAAEQARWLLITLQPHHPLKAIDDCLIALSVSLSQDCEDNFKNPEYEAGYSHGYRHGFDNGRDIGFEEGSDRLMFGTIMHGHFDAQLDNAECERLRIDVERYKSSAGMWRNKCYELGGTPLPWEPEELIQEAMKTEREACARVAGVALLGADKSLADRVVNAIRLRGLE